LRISAAEKILYFMTRV